MACALTNGVLHRQSFKKRTLLLFWENLQVKNVHYFILGILKLILEVQLERNFAQPGHKYAQPGATWKSVSNVVLYGTFRVRLVYTFRQHIEFGSLLFTPNPDIMGSRTWSCNTLMAGVPFLATNSTGPTAPMDIDALIKVSRWQIDQVHLSSISPNGYRNF